MLMVNQLAGFGGRLRRAPAVYYGSAQAAGAGATPSFSLTFPGPEQADRYLAAGIVVFGNISSISGVTIGGVTATVRAVVNSSATQGISAIYTALVPTGASGTVAVTFNTSAARSLAACWAMTGLNGIGTTDTATNSGSGQPNPLTATIDVEAGGIVLAIAGENTGGSRTSTWAGVSENFDVNAFSGGAGNASGGSAVFESLQVGMTVGTTWSGATNQAVLAAAAFR